MSSDPRHKIAPGFHNQLRALFRYAEIEATTPHELDCLAGNCNYAVFE
jgi:hypothetical protein